MAVFELEAEGRTFEIEAPDMESALRALGGGDVGEPVVKQPPAKPTNLKGAFLSDDPSDWELPQNKGPTEPANPDAFLPNAPTISGMVRDIVHAQGAARAGKPSGADVVTLGTLGPGAPGRLATQEGIAGLRGKLRDEESAMQEAFGSSQVIDPRLRNLNERFPEPPAPQALAGRDTVVAAGERQGVAVPSFIASDSLATKRIAGGLKDTPLVGDPVLSATRGMAENLGARVEELAGGATREAAVPGVAAKENILGWTKGGFREEMEATYSPLKGLIEPDTMVPLSRTRAAAGELTALDYESATADGQKVINIVREALRRQEGLSWQGLKELRTRVGERVYGEIAPEAGTSARALDRIYSALTEDVKFGVGRAGVAKAGSTKERALAAFESANDKAKELFAIRRKLTEVVGASGDASPESVFHRIVSMASSKSTEDTQQLLRVKAAVGGSWDKVVDSIVARMGMNERTKDFSPDVFLTTYNKSLSDNGRNILFGKQLRAALDDIATLSKAWSENARYGNISGSGRSVAVVAGLGSAIVNPLLLIGEVAAGNTLARLLSRPATAQQVATVMRAASTPRSPAADKALAAAWKALGPALTDATKVKTIEEALSLKPGTRFYDPMGEMRVR